jgi:hypothetical protein
MYFFKKIFALVQGEERILILVQLLQFLQVVLEVKISFLEIFFVGWLYHPANPSQEVPILFLSKIKKEINGKSKKKNKKMGKELWGVGFRKNEKERKVDTKRLINCI